MSFLADKKREHEAAAEKALVSKDYHRAFFHVAKAAEFGLRLAEKSEGKVARRFLADALDLIEIAESLKQKAKHPSAGKLKSALKEGEEGNGEDWLVSEKPSVRFADVAGMDEAKRKLAQMVIEPLRNPEEARRWGIVPGGGILLYGPPGNGKTTLGKAVAGELDAAFFYATGADIRSKWHGESEKRLRNLIRAARARPVSVLFLDDVDGLLPRRGRDSVVDNRIVVQFLADIGGFEDPENVLLILGATNRPWAIDEAVFRTGRFDEKIFVGLPDQTAREFLVQRAIGSAPVAPDVRVEVVARMLDGYTGSDIVAIIQSAKRSGFRRALAEQGAALSLADITQAMETIPSSATPELMRKYEEFAKKRFK